MRILVLVTDAYGGHGGIALFNRELIGALSMLPAAEEIVVVPRVIVRKPEPIPPHVTFLGRAARGRVAYMRALRAAVRNQRFDFVICGHVNLLPLTSVVPGAPLLITHGIEAWKPLRDPVSNRMLHSLRGVVSVSDLTRARFLSWSKFAGPSFVLPNTVHAEQYGIRPKSDALLDRYHLRGRRVLMTLGRIVAAERYKGFDEVLEILPDLDSDIAYLIAGGGSDRARLERKARELGVADRVVFTGLFPEAEKADLYNLADVYVMPSRGEGFGFVFLEAMACGVPVIASRHDGGREAVRNGELGLLVDSSNPAEIRTAITDTLLDARREVPAELEYFSYDRFVERVHAIISATEQTTMASTRS